MLAGGSTEEGVATIQVGTVAARQVAQKEGRFGFKVEVMLGYKLGGSHVLAWGLMGGDVICKARTCPWA